MGSGKGGRDLGRWLSQRVWVVCLMLCLVVAALHLTASHTPAVAASIRQWTRRPEMAALPHDKVPGSALSEEAALAAEEDELWAEEEAAAEEEYMESIHGEEARNAALPTAPNRAEVHNVRTNPRVAICLVGGARSFELTGLSIKKYVLDAYNNSDIFLHVPFDRNAHKLTLLHGASKLAMARVFKNSRVKESAEAREVLTAANSPNGIQGLLQYFRLVEGCLTMISTYEKRHGFHYDWIVRTRVDGYWSGPLPPLRTLNPRYYHVPFGCRYGGLNDRLGIGTRDKSWAALSRLALIPKLHDYGYRSLNSEAFFKHQLDVSRVRPRFDDFRFCILTARKYAWPLHRWGVPVASIKSQGALNGAKCKPCRSVVRGDAAHRAVQVLDRGWGWIHPVSDLRLCDARQALEPGWQSMFDEVSGPEVARVRQRITNRTEEECVREVEQFGQLWENWNAPSAERFCKRPGSVRLNRTEAGQ